MHNISHYAHHVCITEGNLFRVVMWSVSFSPGCHDPLVLFVLDDMDNDWIVYLRDLRIMTTSNFFSRSDFYFHKRNPFD